MAGKLGCSVCGDVVADGVLEDGRARHYQCVPAEELVRVTVSLARSDVEVFRRLGAGNTSEGARFAARACNSMSREELEKYKRGA